MSVTQIIKFVNWMLFSTLVILIWQMFNIKGQVQDFNFQLKQLNSQLTQEYKQFNVLKAEFAYLQSPDRLRVLTNKYLELAAVQTTQLISNPLSSEQSNIAISEDFNQISKQAYTKWRYKKTPLTSTIVTTVSTKVQ